MINNKLKYILSIYSQSVFKFSVKLTILRFTFDCNTAVIFKSMKSGQRRPLHAVTAFFCQGLRCSFHLFSPIDMHIIDEAASIQMKEGCEKMTLKLRRSEAIAIGCRVFSISTASSLATASLFFPYY